MGSDNGRWHDERGRINFNPRSPHGERQCPVSFTVFQCVISIHAPRMGSDSLCRHKQFAGTISIHAPRMGSDLAGGGTVLSDDISIPAPRMGSDDLIGVATAQNYISIHAPRMGSDGSPGQFPYWQTDFNPRSPHGERLNILKSTSNLRIFQSTLPAWGATVQSKHTAMTA